MADIVKNLHDKIFKQIPANRAVLEGEVLRLNAALYLAPN